MAERDLVGQARELLKQRLAENHAERRQLERALKGLSEASPRRRGSPGRAKNGRRKRARAARPRARPDQTE